MPPTLDRIKQEGSALTAATRQQLATYILSGFGFIAGLAWNEAVKSAIDLIWPAASGGVWAKIVYAIVITFLVVAATIIVNRVIRREIK